MNRNQTKKITDSDVANAKSSEREYVIHDSEVRGLSLRLHPSGAKSWTVRKVVDGVPRHVHLGGAEQIGVDRARVLAHEKLSKGLAPGLNTNSSAISFRAFEKMYYKRTRMSWKESTRRSYVSHMRSRIMPAFAHRDIASISRADVARWFHDSSVLYPGGANRNLDFLRSMFSAAIRWGLLPAGYVNPCVGIKKNRREHVGRVISEEELSRLGTAMSTCTSRSAEGVAILKLLLLTGCRLREVLQLTWGEVRGDHIALKDAKCGPRIVPLNPAAKNILMSRKPTTQESYVFPSPRNPSRPRRDVNSVWNTLKKAADLDSNIRIHDLRHTFASHALMSGESMIMTGALLGHKNHRSTSRYVHLQDDHLLAAAERVSCEISKYFSNLQSRFGCKPPACYPMIANKTAHRRHAG